MKRILTIIISVICIYANSQTTGRFPYYSILQTYWGDSLRTSFDTDTVKWTTNQKYYSIDKPLYIMGNLAGIGGINITQAGSAPAINITKTHFVGSVVEIHNEANAFEIINIYNSSSVKEFQLLCGGYLETNGDIRTQRNFWSKGAHLRADLDYTLPYTMTLAQNVWQRIDLKDVGDVSNDITLTGDSILCKKQGSINLHFEFNLQNVASKEYEYRIRRNGVTLRTIKVTGTSTNIARTINYVHKNVGTGYYSIEIRSTSSSPGDVIFYTGYCYAKMENMW